MELRHLRYFLAVAEELNFYRAAERVHVDQSPMSRTIQALEDELNVKLFVRSRQGTRITPAGVRFLVEVKDIFARIDQAVRVVREVDGRCRMPLRVGIADGMVQPRLSQCLAQWRELLPKTELDLRELRSCQVPDLLRREEIDVTFRFGLAGSDGVTQEAIWMKRAGGEAPCASARCACFVLILRPFNSRASDLLAHRSADVVLRRRAAAAACRCAA
jgi:DNA-binding transcriptional LysR family regulator